MKSLVNRAFLAYDIENIFGGTNVPTKIKEIELAIRSTHITAITPGVPIMKSTAMSKSFIKYRELDIPTSRIHLGAFQFVKGRDAADLYLIDVLFNNPAVLRSSDIIIASGDMEPSCFSTAFRIRLISAPADFTANSLSVLAIGLALDGSSPPCSAS